jgi:hypothetical protein
MPCRGEKAETRSCCLRCSSLTVTSLELRKEEADLFALPSYSYLPNLVFHFGTFLLITNIRTM